MLSIDSKQWRVRSYNDAYAEIEQRASRTWRVVFRSALPSAEQLAAMTEQRFNAVLRAAFHGERAEYPHRTLRAATRRLASIICGKSQHLARCYPGTGVRLFIIMPDGRELTLNAARAELAP